MRCVNPNIIEDFADCDTSLTRVRGRTGGWYGAADVGINLSFSVSVPPSGFSDRRCGAWVTGGPTGNGSATWAVMGVGFSQSSAPYDLRGYTGITVDLEAESVDFTLKTTNGGYFGYRLPRTSGSQAFQVSFSQLQPRSDSATQILDLGAVTDIQFTPINAMVGFGFVIHGLTLIR
jgi:hypothetical protein